MFGLGGGGGPSNQDVIDEVKRGFAEQRQFIGLEFSKQKIFIKDQFQKQHDLLTQNIASQLEIQNVYIFGLFVKLQDSNSISRLEIARNEVIREIEDISIQALGLLDETSNKMIFVQSFDNDINDDVAEKIHDALNVLETKDDAELRHFIEKRCLPELSSCLNNDLKKTCIFMIETMMTIEKYKEMTVTVLINILQRTKLRELNKGYLQTEKSNKEALKSWMERILLDKRVGCLLLNFWQADQWTKDEQQINILNYITHTDLQMRKALDTFKYGEKKEYCQQLNQGVWSGRTCEARVVDGHWESWGSWGSCESTCKMDRHRSCNNPPPRNGGKSCLGPKLQTKCCKGGLCLPGGCQNGWNTHSDPSICYKVFRQKMKWSDARNYCHQHKGELASVSSSTNHYLGLMAEGPAWIGGYRTGNTWRWTDGSASRFTSWRTGQPDNYGGRQDKALINFDGIGIWDDQENYQRHAFICQRQAQKYGIQVHSGDVYEENGKYREYFLVEKLLTLSRPEGHWTKGTANYWLAPNEKSSVGFILDLIQPTNIGKIQLVNTHNGIYKDRATREFQVFFSESSRGPWALVLSASLPDSRNVNPVPMSTFNIPPVSARFVKFNLVSYWGQGGGLQYFHVIKLECNNVY